ncbi:cation:proton antiporter [Microbacterium sp.]|uniref:cation:proton antiporter n=2 Tax=Microbacterium sp. TaxID=51671 RepID=UPI00092A131B|nr:cation:proton antiporter [Microbacterium sp.]MBN9187889.1 cation:proton antiporter [Microbacterium sp.]MBN9193222.1 cation:proton antiporter [Microbacterium sp.]OJU57864.1 MAG: cation/H(+) antiporter [Microbacterium sp. 70-38]
MDLTLLVIPLLAVLAPVAARVLGRWVRIPVVVFELVLGIIVGPSVLGWAQPADFVHTLSQFGLAMLFFVAGTEIEFGALTGRTGRGAILGWLLSIAAGVALGWILAPGETAVILGIALASTALGTLLPILRDANELRTPFGRSVGALGAVGEFGPLVAISLFLGSRTPGVATIVLAVFVAIAAGAVWYALRVPQGALHRFVGSTLHTSGQFAIRVVFLILAALVILSITLDIDMLLGAFAAGLVWRLLIRDASPADREAVESKIEAVAFGFLVPVFFIYTGITFDLAALLAQPVLLLLVPIALVALLVVRGVPSLLAAPERSSGRERVAVVLMGATGLPIVVAVTSEGVEKGILPSWAAAVLVGAGMLSVLLFPLVAMLLRGERVPRSAMGGEEA